MNRFCVVTYCSINLNFLVYIYNIYSNSYKTSSDNIFRFPYHPIDKRYLLDHEDFQMLSKSLWTEILYTNNLQENDIDLWISKEFSFETLFINENSENDIYQEINTSFEAYYWNIGNFLCCSYYNALVIEFYDSLVNHANQIDKPLKDFTLTLQIVYDLPSQEWPLKSKDSYVVCPGATMPEVSEVVSLCVRIK